MHLLSRPNRPAFFRRGIINSKSEHHPKTNYAATHAEYLKTVFVKQVEDAVMRASSRRTKMTLGWNKTANFFIGQTLYYSKYLD